MATLAWAILAADDQDRTADAFKDERTLWLTAALVGVLLLGALILSWLQRWRKRQFAADPGPVGQLTTFRALYERGELSKEEYERIRSRVAERAKASPAAKRPETPAPPAPPASTEPILPPPPEQTG